MTRFVPNSQNLCEKSIKKFVSALESVGRLVVLTGAGISTESGIPDYRSEGVGLYARSNHKPILHNEFMKSEKVRQRYWARNYLAWPAFGNAKCNKTHYALSNWEKSDQFVWLITQNVDGLHTQAGSQMLTELHGSARNVRCMNCDFTESRLDFQEQLRKLNNGFMERYTNPGELAPDGDIMLESGAEKDFEVPNCSRCSGIMKTDVVFFGDFVKKDVVDLCHEKVDEADGVLVLGSSLTVMSGYRFVYHANQQQKPIFIVNIGATRADHLATMKLEYKASSVVDYI